MLGRYEKEVGGLKIDPIIGSTMVVDSVFYHFAKGVGISFPVCIFHYIRKLMLAHAYVTNKSA